MPRLMPAVPQWLKADVTGPAIGVDRPNKILRGYVVAQEGPFKTPGRGEFDEKALKSIVKLGNRSPQGLKSRFNHATLSDDAPGKHLGRVKDFRMDQVEIMRNGDWQEVQAVRADLHFDPTSFATPHGDLGGYVLDLVASDPEAISSSLVLQLEEEYRLEKDGTPKRDEAGNPMPPLWRPTVLHASDIVDEGDAVDGILSTGQLPDRLVRLGTELLDSAFAGQTWDVIEARCLAWLARYKNLRFGESVPTHGPSPIAAALPEIRRADRLRRLLTLTQAARPV